MEPSVTVIGQYVDQQSRHVSSYWKQICADHEEEFPQIRQCYPGTFNILMTRDPQYTPPNEHQYRDMAKARGQSVKRYEDGNHVSPCAKVVEINGKAVEAWLYRGGHRTRPILELLSHVRLAHALSIQNRDEVTVLIHEVAEGTTGMPRRPPAEPGVVISNVENNQV